MLIARALLFSFVVLLAGNADLAHAQNGFGGRSNFNPYTPIFTNSQIKLAETANKRFTSVFRNWPGYPALFPGNWPG
jgi:hypothetical protein